MDNQRNRVGQILYGQEWSAGHDYDEGEVKLAKLADLLPLDDDIILRKDGNKWMCVKGDFVNLQESKSWWGDTLLLAFADYLSTPTTESEQVS